MNNKRRKTRELNKLSAYLDNALSAREVRKLEAQLAVDPELQAKLDGLRWTKLALSQLPRQQAPCNFTLTPDMVPERKSRKQSLRMTLRLASALAAILLVVLFGAEFILSEIRQPMMLDAEAPMMEAARVADEATPEPLIQWGAPGGQAGGMGGDSAAMEEPIEEPVLEMEPLPEEEPAPEIESLPEEAPETQEEEAEEAPASKGGDLILGINPDQGGEIIERSQPSSVQQEPTGFPWQEILRWSQIALAIIAVGGGLALLLLRTRSRTKAR